MPATEPREFVAVRIAVMTVSDTRDETNDTSGDTLAARIKDAGHVLAARVIVTDDQAKIAAQLRRWIDDPQIDVVISTGGTGLTGRDVTVEAFKSVFEKEIDGFSAIFHRISYEKIGTSTIQSRACAGVAKGTYLFALPGSPGAVKDGWDGILKAQLDIRHKPCNFVEIMPRLMEHEHSASPATLRPSIDLVESSMERPMELNVEALDDAQLKNLIANYRNKNLSDHIYLKALAEQAKRTGKGLNFDTTMRVVKKAAAERRFVSYAELAEASGADWNQVHFAIGSHLGDLIEYCHRNGLPLLSAIVVNKPNVKTGEMETSSLNGFVAGARSLKIPVVDPVAFLKQEQEKVFRWAAASSPK